MISISSSPNISNSNILSASSSLSSLECVNEFSELKYTHSFNQNPIYNNNSFTHSQSCNKPNSVSYDSVSSFCSDTTYEQPLANSSIGKEALIAETNILI